MIHWLFTWGAGSLLLQVSVFCACRNRFFLEKKSNIDANACEDDEEEEDGGDNDDNDDTDDTEPNL